MAAELKRFSGIFGSMLTNLPCFKIEQLLIALETLVSLPPQMIGTSLTNAPAAPTSSDGKKDVFEQVPVFWDTSITSL